METKTGVLLINLGTPDAPSEEKVRDYLKEFLMDRWVVDLAYPLRWFLVNAIILRKRPAASSALYRKIWTSRGSPLLFHTQDLAAKVADLLGTNFVVRMGMRYGKPSIKSALESLREAGVARVVVAPLYPQYSEAATRSSVEECRRAWRELEQNLHQEAIFKFVPAFYDEPAFIDAFVAVARRELSRLQVDHVIFSFHGLPERQIRKTDRSGSHCLRVETCCDSVGQVNNDCYRARSFATARSLAARLELVSYSVAFQSRLGATAWIKPYTDQLYDELPKKGIKRLAVISPSFVADCLETLEEIAIRGKEQFLAAGGEELHLIPSLNSEDIWALGVCQLIQKTLSSS